MISKPSYYLRPKIVLNHSKYGYSYVHRLTDKKISPKLRFKSCTSKNLCNWLYFNYSSFASE